MRKLAILALLAALAIPALAAPSVVQTCFGSGYQAPATCAFASSIAAGDVLVVIQMDTSFTAATMSAPTGCSGLTCTLVDQDTSTGFAEWIAADAAGGVCQPVISSSDSLARHDVDGMEVSGVTATVDAHAYVYQTGLSTPTSPTITTSVAGDLIVSANCDYNAKASVWTVASPYTKQVDMGNASLADYWGGSATLIQPAAGAQAGGAWSNANGGTNYADSGTFALEPSGAGPPPCPHTLTTLGAGCG